MDGSRFEELTTRMNNGRFNESSVGMDGSRFDESSVGLNDGASTIDGRRTQPLRMIDNGINDSGIICWHW